MGKYIEEKNAIKTYLDALRELKRLNLIVNSKDFTSQIGEWLASRIYDGQLAKSGIQKDWDIKSNIGLIQVKSHAKATTTSARWSALKYNENADVDYVVIIVFDSNYSIQELYKIPWKDALLNIKRQKHRDVINWNDLKSFHINLGEIPTELFDIFNEP